jgi:hypothetical protein
MLGRIVTVAGANDLYNALARYLNFHSQFEQRVSRNSIRVEQSKQHGLVSGRFGIPVESGWSGFPEALTLLVGEAQGGGLVSGDRTCYSTRMAPWSAMAVGRWL